MIIPKSTIKCPNCGFEVPTRAAIGQGTQRAKNMRMNDNRQAIIDVLVEAVKPMSVADVHKRLIEKKIVRKSKRGTGWNYHTVQADISSLVGGGHVEMVKPLAQEIYDGDEGHITESIPLYVLRTKLAFNTPPAQEEKPKCMFLKEGKCNSDYAKGIDCDGKTSKNCPYR